MASKHARTPGVMTADGFQVRRTSTHSPISGRSNRKPYGYEWRATKRKPWQVRAENRRRSKAARLARRANR